MHVFLLSVQGMLVVVDFFGMHSLVWQIIVIHVLKLLYFL